MNYLIALALLILLIYSNFESIAKQNLHGAVPEPLKHDNLLINMGTIPERLAWSIPMEFELREDYGMKSRIEPIFINGRKRPLWGLIITLRDSWCESECRVLYDLQGNLYEH